MRAVRMAQRQLMGLFSLERPAILAALHANQGLGFLELRIVDAITYFQLVFIYS